MLTIAWSLILLVSNVTCEESLQQDHNIVYNYKDKVLQTWPRVANYYTGKTTAAHAIVEEDVHWYCPGWFKHIAKENCPWVLQHMYKQMQINFIDARLQAKR